MRHCALIPYNQLVILQDLSCSSSFTDVADHCVLCGKVEWELEGGVGSICNNIIGLLLILSEFSLIFLHIGIQSDKVV